MLDSVLVANRGEIAARVVRTCRRLGIRSVVVHSDADADARAVRLADEAVRIGPAPAADSYLDVGRIVDAARRSGVSAVHPGYGFLSENPLLPEALAAAGIGWVGPSPEVIRLMGDKAAAKAHLAAAGVPVVPGIDDPDLDDEALRARMDEVGYPLLVKAVAGGGGKGMRAVQRAADAAAAITSARREAMGAFGDDRLIVERLVTEPRHVEVQVVGDRHGTVLHVLERDCSLQRRHQKVVEEAPAAHLAPAVRAALHAAAVDAARAVSYEGAGTVEFLLDANGRDFYFLEMNTRLQVEHPVTEMVTGLDLVELQLRVAAGEPLGLAQEDVAADGHAIEVRVYAEDPAVGFLPQTGPVLDARWPDEDGIRVDHGVVVGGAVTPHYDPMLAKVIAHGPDRDTALARLRRAVAGTTLLGVRHNLEWLGDLLAEPAVGADEVSTAWLDRWDWIEPPTPRGVLAAAAAATAVPRDGSAASPFAAVGARRFGASAPVARLRDRGAEHHLGVHLDAAGDPVVAVVVDDAAGRVEPVAVPRTALVARDGDVVWVHAAGRTRPVTIAPATRHVDLDATGGDASLASPMPGAVVTVDVEEGDVVAAGQTLLVVEAMKMEHPVVAPTAGIVVQLEVGAGDAVEAGQPLVTVHPEEPEED